MIRLGCWCARRPRGAAFPAGRRWGSGGPAGRAGGRSLRVLVDMDGVLADFEGGFLRKFRARFPDQPYIALEDRRGFWLSEQYGRLQPGLSEKAISIWESENFFLDLEPLPGAVEAVKQMANLENTDVFICTSPIKMYKYCPYEKGISKLHFLFGVLASACFSLRHTTLASLPRTAKRAVRTACSFQFHTVLQSRSCSGAWSRAVRPRARALSCSHRSACALQRAQSPVNTDDTTWGSFVASDINGVLLT
ncbi:5'(3')-deoxyribonucleotidase, mitochondrial isoform X1 [Lynx canadensis]|uniref:5'(3')-deoxyribonucleotidase, mitochondrial isoform X1 n=1 Tax=Lynx canadensis TaxID=61383 RepID=UPI0011AFEC44|nr:5'(3')-deoxyribonucleotidase, mitochondrial isoform X1 [Lynx canadensis]